MLKFVSSFVLIVWSGALAQDPPDMKILFPSNPRSEPAVVTINRTEPGEPGGVTLSGNYNYYAAQQIFYVYGPQHTLLRNQEEGQPVQWRKDGYLYSTGIGAHKLYTQKLTWNKARQFCVQAGGHLAIINSMSEESVLLSLMGENNVGEAWLGIHDLFEEGDWATLLDEGLGNAGYSRWSTKFSNLPDNYEYNQHCGVLLKEGGMDDVACNIVLPFLCEISSPPHQQTGRLRQNCHC